MKKINLLLGALALGSMLFVSCEKDNGDGSIDFDTVVEDGFYVGGPATGSDALAAEFQMSAGFNEVSKETRDGMYEKYIWLEGGKEFELVLSKAQKGTRYSATLADFDAKELADNPKEMLQKGFLQIGDEAPAMKVKESGLYHIILDLNTLGDLEDAQIVIAPAKWGVRGAMNGWGFTPAKMTKDGKKLVYVVENQRLVEGKEFKFAHCDGWKVNLDKAEKVKAEVSFGVKDDALEVGAPNITVKETGEYKITLVYEMKGGSLANSFSYTAELTKPIKLDYPNELYMIGAEFGNWNWEDKGLVTMTPVNGKPGHFWAVRQITKDQGFKFNSKKAWGGDFCKKNTNTGFKEKDGNCVVEKDGLYMVYVNFEADAITVEPAKICGMGDAFGNWDAGKNVFDVKDGKASAKLAKDGALRIYAEFSGKLSDWWTREFNIYDGKIVYRGTGNDQPAVPVKGGQTVTLDFNAGTATIK